MAVSMEICKTRNIAKFSITTLYVYRYVYESKFHGMYDLISVNACQSIWCLWVLIMIVSLGGIVLNATLKCYLSVASIINIKCFFAFSQLEGGWLICWLETM